MNIQIRPAAVADSAEIAQVRVTTWRKAYRGMIPDSVLDELDVARETERYQEFIASMPPEQAFLIAEVDTPRSRVVGYCNFGPDRDPTTQGFGEIYALYVLPEHQGQGIGKALVQAAGRSLAERGFQRMIIFVLRENTPSRKFYEAIGGRAEREQEITIRGFPAHEVGYAYDLAGATL